MLSGSSLNTFVSRANGTDSDQSQASDNPYGYQPSFAVAVLFLTLFGITTFVHFIQACYHRKWFFLYTAVFAGAIEIAGWYGREWSSRDVTNQNAFTIQIICTIVGPTPLLAANFIILSRLIRKLGEGYSRLSPRLYSRIFVSCDVFGFFVQVGGGSIASGDNPSQKTVDLGSNIMLGGVAFQTFVIVCYMVLAAEYFWRFAHERPSVVVQPERTSIEVLSIIAFDCSFMWSSSTLAVFSSDPYIELSNWKTDFKATLFIPSGYVFDATMVVLAMFAYNFAHFGRLVDESDNNDMQRVDPSPSSEYLAGGIPIERNMVLEKV
ncbi:RTA1 like protein-domain-containing protein [Rhodocollybia butyracea]|uniref:RTA1 like protein-domain-containing protein n=1 Tax=Rhodocollybia butyracea TaxID=206335 RepID=A0A9P5Q141_9AGAR|nr:RTA1 like protein-domain-containing protein [Rhodocollybia butyracea]